MRGQNLHCFERIAHRLAAWNAAGVSKAIELYRFNFKNVAEFVPFSGSAFFGFKFSAFLLKTLSPSFDGRFFLVAVDLLNLPIRLL